jgi:membrane fusion protein (multidrug efflux system)
MGQQDKDKDKDESAPVPVELTRAVRGDISTTILSTTTIDTEVKVDVYPKHSGPIVLMRAEEGNYVQPGQLLAQIDPAEHELSLKQTEASYEELKTTFTRLETMHKNKMTSQEAYDAARFAYEKAKIALDMAKLQVENTRVISPIKGLIILRGIRYGERVTPATLAYSILDMESRIAEVHLPESEIGRVRPGLAVEIRTDAQAEKVFPGRVRKISPAVDPRSGTVKVTVDLDDTEQLLRPGMFVRVNIVVDTHKDTVLVPRAAALNVDDKLAVFVARPAPTPTSPPEEPEADKAEAPRDKPGAKAGAGAAVAADLAEAATPKKPEQPHEVVERVFFEAGYQNESFIEALSGVQPGDRLVHVGQQGLQPGAKIVVVDGSGNGAAEPAKGEPKNPAP